MSLHVEHPAADCGEILVTRSSNDRWNVRISHGDQQITASLTDENFALMLNGRPTICGLAYCNRPHRYSAMRTDSVVDRARAWAEMSELGEENEPLVHRLELAARIARERLEANRKKAAK